MAEKRFTIAGLSDVDAIPVGDSLTWRPVRRHLGIGAFGVNAYTAVEAGEEVVEDHDETGDGAGRHEELYFVASGAATFALDGETVDAPAGTFVFVAEPAVRRHATAAAPDTTVLAIGGRRGEPYEVSPWEYWFAAIPAARAGDYERAVAIVEEGLAARPENASLLYNLACYEALGGRREPALEHVRKAIELDPKLGAVARADTDLDAIREDPGFPAAAT